jgi:hypothetical protein
MHAAAANDALAATWHADREDRTGPGRAPGSAETNRVAPRPEGVARFERFASAAVAFVSLAAAIAALINEVRRGPR